MKKILMRGAQIELYFRAPIGNKIWVPTTAKTDLAFAFEFNPKQHNELWLDYTHWAWVDEEEHIYMLFHEKDLMP